MIPESAWQQLGADSAFEFAEIVLEVVSFATDVAGTHSAGFFSKKLDARIIMLTGSAGMIGKSSVRGKCVRPNCI